MQLVGIGNSPPSPQGKGSRRPPLCAGGRWTGRVPATLVHRGAPSPGAGRDRLNAFRLCWCAGVPYPTAPEGRERDASRPSLVRRGGGGESCPTEAAEERAASLFYWHREKKAGGAFTADAKRREAGSNLPRQREKQRDGPWPTDGWGRRGKRQFYPPSWKRGERHPHRHGGKTGGSLPCRRKAKARAGKPPLACQKKRGMRVPPRRHRETGRAANRPHRRREKRGWVAAWLCWQRKTVWGVSAARRRGKRGVDDIRFLPGQKGGEECPLPPPPIPRLGCPLCIQIVFFELKTTICFLFCPL